MLREPELLGVLAGHWNMEGYHWELVPIIPLRVKNNNDCLHLLSLSLPFRGKQLPGPGSRTAERGNSWRRGCGCVCERSLGSPPTWGPRTKLHPPCNGICSLYRGVQGALYVTQRVSWITASLLHCCSHSLSCATFVLTFPRHPTLLMHSL